MKAFDLFLTRTGGLRLGRYRYNQNQNQMLKSVFCVMAWLEGRGRGRGAVMCVVAWRVGVGAWLVEIAKWRHEYSLI